jgi:hypothetical protein
VPLIWEFIVADTVTSKSMRAFFMLLKLHFFYVSISGVDTADDFIRAVDRFVVPILQKARFFAGCLFQFHSQHS